jgi:hypothetical protein
MKRTLSTTRARLGGLLFLAAVYVTQSGYDGCTGDLLHDSGFDVWCGERLCSWKVERGEALQAPTWHDADLGVDLVGDDVVLTQRADIDHHIAPCVRFELVADVAEDASVTLGMDLLGDGELDYEAQLPTSSWAPLVYLVRMPTRYQGIVFRLAKSGGHAVLAQIRARTVPVEECEGAVEIEDLPVALGGSCWSLDPDEPFTLLDEVCASGQCVPGRPGSLQALCAACEDDAGCADGEVCGVEVSLSPFVDPYRTCIPAASRTLGQLCQADAECATGICCEGACSTCCDAGDRECEAGRACGASVVEGGPRAPYQCDPGEGRGVPGEACLTDEDCESGECAGGEELRLCPADGRQCAVDADCPPSAADREEGREIGACVAVGTTGGSCQ